MVNHMTTKHLRKNKFLKLTTLCYLVFILISLIILNSCLPTFASLDYDEPFDEVENALYEKNDKSMTSTDGLEENPDELEENSDEIEENLDDLEENPDDLEENPDDLEENPDDLEENPDDLAEEPDELEEEWPERVVFLTFDDGPGSYTDRLLDVLYEENVLATFFVLGSSILETLPHSEILMKRMLEEGHYIGLHTMSHQYYTLYVGYGAPSRFVAEMLELQDWVYDLVGHNTYLCRAAYGMMTGFRPGHYVAVDEAGLKCIDWNIDPQDWRNNAQRIYEEVVRQVELLNFPPELVIVLHEYEQTVEALPFIIDFLREHGYVFKIYEPGYEFTYYQYQQ